MKPWQWQAIIRIHAFPNNRTNKCSGCGGSIGDTICCGIIENIYLFIFWYLILLLLLFLWLEEIQTWNFPNPSPTNCPLSQALLEAFMDWNNNHLANFVGTWSHVVLRIVLRKTSLNVTKIVLPMFNSLLMLDWKLVSWRIDIGRIYPFAFFWSLSISFLRTEISQYPQFSILKLKLSASPN